jgi:predicted dehydrogenase
MKSGRTVNFEVSWAAHTPTDGRENGIDLMGTLAGLALHPARMFRNGASGYETVHLASLKVPHAEDRMHHFVSCVLENKKPLVSLEESLKVQKILDAIYASSATGKEVRVS